MFCACGVVCDTAKVRVFKQITTGLSAKVRNTMLFAILQKYEFSSKSQHGDNNTHDMISCLRYCKSTSFQANHNGVKCQSTQYYVVCDTAKVRVFKQITTRRQQYARYDKLFAILQKYEFSSKSQLIRPAPSKKVSCLRYCKSTSFQANHNSYGRSALPSIVVCDTAKVRVFKQITTICASSTTSWRCLRYCKCTSFSNKSQRRF